METVLIAGGRGLIGQSLTKALVEKNYNVIILTRKQITETNFSNKVAYAYWDPEKEIINEQAILKSDYIIHLAGENVAEKRWTKKRKMDIVNSRVQSSELIVQCINRYPGKIKAVISASAIGWYGPDPEIPNEHPFTEEAPADTDFLGITCKKWESSITPVKVSGVRLVIVRTGIVLSNYGGAYKEFRKSIKFNFIPILGSGKQIVSWIHIDDLVRIYMESLENEKCEGIFNAVSPLPVSNKKIMKAIGAQIRKSLIPVHVPSLALKIILGEMSVEVLKSCTVSSEKIQKLGFQFLYPSIESAIENLNR